MDEGQQETEKLIEEMKKKVQKHYDQTRKELEKKINDYWKRHKTKDKIKRKQLAAGEISQEEYNEWKLHQLLMGQRWENMRDIIAADMTNAQQIAESIVMGYMPEAYAIGANFGAYQIEKGCLLDTSYTLYDKQTVERLLKDEPELLPALNQASPTARAIREGKILAWHKDQIQSTCLQGILQGESIPEIASRISDITRQDDKATIRYARTMTTGAENAGRINSYNRAESMGIEMEQQWMATLDGRTRHSHRQLDGQHVPVGKKFSNGCKYPGDPDGPAGEIWNCRCTLVAMLTGIPELDDINDLSNTQLRYNDNLNGMSYSEWKQGHGKSQSITHQKEVSESIKWKQIQGYREAAARLKDVKVE